MGFRLCGVGLGFVGFCGSGFSYAGFRLMMDPDSEDNRLRISLV